MYPIWNNRSLNTLTTIALFIPFGYCVYVFSLFTYFKFQRHVNILSLFNNVPFLFPFFFMKISPETPLHISSCIGLLARVSESCCLLVNLFILPSLLKLILGGYRILGRNLFSSSTLKIYIPLAFTFSIKMSDMLSLLICI